MNGLEIGLMGGLIAGLATVTGALPILSKNQFIANKVKNIQMDFIIGLMLSASAFSLIMPAFQEVKATAEIFTLITSLLSGAFFIYIVGIFLKDYLGGQNQKALLFVVAMMVHNLPEGLASGGALTMEGRAHGYSLLTAIAIQNLPEGLTTALSFITLGLSPILAFFGVVATGLVEVIGGLLGGVLSKDISGSLPYIMAFAGGAMMSVTLSELFSRVKEESLKFFFKPSFLSGTFLMIVLSKI